MCAQIRGYGIRSTPWGKRDGTKGNDEKTETADK